MECQLIILNLGFIQSSFVLKYACPLSISQMPDLAGLTQRKLCIKSQTSPICDGSDLSSIAVMPNYRFSDARELLAALTFWRACR
jgi:hypothetical protein